MGLLVITMGPEAEARGMKNSPGPKPKKKEATMAEVLIPLANLSLPDGEEMAEPAVGDTVELTGEVSEIREDGMAVVKVVEAETEKPEAEEETQEPTLEEEGSALRKLAEAEDEAA